MGPGARDGHQVGAGTLAESVYVCSSWACARARRPVAARRGQLPSSLLPPFLRALSPSDHSSAPSPLARSLAPVLQISELYMPQRTDNDIKNRWNSIIRKSQHPAGRDWQPDENEARAAILGSASRTQPRRPGGGGGAAGERKRHRVAVAEGSENLPAHVSNRPRFTEAEADSVHRPSAQSLADDNSPNLGRKLFESPEAIHFDGRTADDDDDEGAVLGKARHTNGEGEGAASRLRAHDDACCDEEEVLPPSDAAEACRMLVGGEIASDTFDVDAFLPLAAASMGSISEMNTPIGEKPRPASRQAQAAAVAGDWFDPELDSSLSPILTPSLRHQLRALMASKSPTPRAGRSAASGAVLLSTPSSAVSLSRMHAPPSASGAGAATVTPVQHTQQQQLHSQLHSHLHPDGAGPSASLTSLSPPIDLATPALPSVSSQQPKARSVDSLESPA